MESREKSRGEARDMVHRGLNQDQGRNLLKKIIEDVQRREDSILETVSLFGKHAALDKKLGQIKGLKKALLVNNFWLLRESSTVPNFLAVDYIRFDHATREWIMRSDRLAYTLNGWRFVDPRDRPSTIPGCLEMNADLAEDYMDSLLQYLDEHGFYSNMIVIPEINELPDEPVYPKLEM